MKNKMQMYMRMFILAVILVGFGTTYLPASAQDVAPSEPSPRDIEAIYRAAVDALNAGDLEGNLKYYSEDAVFITLPPPPGVAPVTVGKEANREWTITFLESHPNVQFTDFHVNGETISFRSINTDDFLKASGVGYLEFSGTAIVRDGLIVSETYLMGKQSLERLIAADKMQSNKDLVRRFYREIWSEGNMDTLDEIVHEDFIDHFTGVNGREAFRDTINLFRTAFPDLDVSYENVVTNGDIVVAQVAIRGTYQGGFADIFGVPDSAIGKEIVLSGVDYARIVDGQYVEGWGAHDELGWFGQFGMKLVVDNE